MAKLTAANYRLFKKTFKLWQERFGLVDYMIFFQQEKLDDCWAMIEVDIESMTAVVTVSTSFKYQPDDEEIERVALHECLHLLLARMATYAVQRFVELQEVESAEEQLVNRITTTLLGLTSPDKKQEK